MSEREARPVRVGDQHFPWARLVWGAGHRPLEARDGRWMIPSVSAHRRMIDVAGFDVVEVARPYAIPFGPDHPAVDRSVRGRAVDFGRRVAARGSGVPMSAVLSRPAVM